jgi:hypothetical protein
MNTGRFGRRLGIFAALHRAAEGLGRIGRARGRDPPVRRPATNDRRGPDLSLYQGSKTTRGRSMKGIRKLVITAGIAAALAATALPASAVPPGPTIAANVNGRVQVDAGLCANGDARSLFTDVTIAGAFTRQVAAFVGTVSVDNVPVCLDPIVNGQQLLATGTLQPGVANPTYASTLGVGSVAGELTGLTFTNVGVAAVAMVDTNFSVNGGTNSGNVDAVAVVLVAPLQTIACQVGAGCGNPNVRDIVAAAIVA